MNRALLALVLLLVGRQGIPAVPEAVAPATEEEIDAAVVEANEPRYVAPTTRDRIGRVWVPVLIDGKGPYRLVLDTGALNSAVTEQTAVKLGVPPGTGTRVMVRGSTGAAITHSIPAATLSVGDLLLRTRLLPIVPHAFGGADGLLGTEGLGEHRIEIDFRRDRIHIARSRNRRAAPGYSTVRFLPDPMNLLVVQAAIGGKKVRAIIDTGAHATVGNLALQRLLQRRIDPERIGDTQIFGATGAVQLGVMTRLPELRLGELVVQDMRATFADLYLFNTWQLGDEPALLIGMDVLGLVESLVIDYRRHELHIKPRS